MEEESPIIKEDSPMHQDPNRGNPIFRKLYKLLSISTKFSIFVLKVLQTL